jgi:hypothetical protein
MPISIGSSNLTQQHPGFTRQLAAQDLRRRLRRPRRKDKLMRKQEWISFMDLSLLKPFHGYQSSIIPLTSGYYFYLASWDSTPTPYSRFSNVWLVTPQNKRILFSDPLTSSEVVCLYHEFNEIYAASISLDWMADSELHVRCESLEAGYDLNAKFTLSEPLTSRLLVALGSGPPTPFRVSKTVVSVSNFLVNALAAGGGSLIIGRTETGQPFYPGDTERLFQVVSGSITLNREELGKPTHPTWPIEFGDAVPYYNPVIKLGTLYIPFDQSMLGKNA